MLDFEIDKLTHSIENTQTGESCPTEVLPLEKSDLKAIMKKNGWSFDWKKEFSDASKEVYKLILSDQPAIIQGIISFSDYQDHIFIDLIESAPFNIGKGKRYYGVMGNLVSFACKISFSKEYDGCVSFIAKTVLIEHYRNTLGAFFVGNQRMVIEKNAASKLVNIYFPDFFNNKK